MRAERIRTQGLTEGAILAALVAVLAVATHYIPLLGIATVYLCPLPLAVLVIRHGFRVAALATVVSILAAITVAGPVVGLFILVLYAPIGIVLGIGARQRWTAPRVVGIAFLVSVLSTTLSFFGLMGGGSLSMTEMASAMERSVDTYTGLYARLGMTQAQIDAVAKQMREAARLLPYLLPAILVLTAAFAAWLNYEVGRRVLLRLSYHLPALPPIRTWRVPVAVIWFLPLSYVLLGAGAHPGAPAVLQSAGWSLTLSLQMLFAFQGIMVGWVILGNYGFGRLAQITAVAMVMVVPALSVLVYMLGIVDSVLKVRDRWGLPRSAVPGARS